MDLIDNYVRYGINNAMVYSNGRSSYKFGVKEY
ncbi:hypothetical protein MBFIL_15570 [Methanobrevibacter filiformis]|uniref:Uncharacterized protein n=1 Tax=Methanobrevibacter filiformis TaxID=55758 RepID=A0A166C3N2_9EURY|nr:hypothetical protein MBFIL_15570 [Methanobrevibacter filiformis]